DGSAVPHPPPPATGEIPFPRLPRERTDLAAGYRRADRRDCPTRPRTAHRFVPAGSARARTGQVPGRLPRLPRPCLAVLLRRDLTLGSPAPRGRLCHAAPTRPTSGHRSPPR